MEEISILWLIYGPAAALLLFLGIVFYLRSAASRQTYRCSQCGESFRVELMDASHCNHCGAPLKKE